VLVSEHAVLIIPLCTALRVEWAKAKCRADRWVEEPTLLSEEMRRVLVYTRKSEQWWQKRAASAKSVNLHPHVEPQNFPDSQLVEGRRPYALQQAAIEHLRAEAFRSKFLPVISHARLSVIGKFLAWDGTDIDANTASSDSGPIRIIIDEDDCERFYNDDEE
jgi:hypothetical protein